MNPPAARRAFPVKLYTVIAATIPVLISSALLGLVASNYYTSEQTRRWVLQNRATTKIVVQWLSMALSACQIYVLSSVLRFWTSTRLIARPLKLDVLKLLDALAACHLDVDVPKSFFTVLVLYLCIIQLPGALWAEYSDSTRYSSWGYYCPPNYRCDGMTTINSTTLGSFSYQAWKDITGLLVNSVRDASSSDNSTVPQYDKLDNTRYKYHGRSFGVGSTVGLVGDPKPSEKDLGRPLLSYTYREVGYQSKVTCRVNEASNLKIEVSTDVGLQTIYQVTDADTFWRNSLNVMRRNGRNNQTDEDFTTGIAEGLEVILDNILGNTGASQAMIGDTKSVQADVTYQAMHIGEAKYTYSAFALSFLILLLITLDALRTGFWADLPLFNPLDVKSAILGVAASTGHPRPEIDHWDGDAADRDAGAIEIMSSDRELKLIFQSKIQRTGRTNLSFQGHIRSPNLHMTSSNVPLLQLQQEQLLRNAKRGPSVHEAQLWYP